MLSEAVLSKAAIHARASASWYIPNFDIDLKTRDQPSLQSLYGVIVSTTNALMSAGLGANGPVEQ